ncbi:cytochrome c oxidase assembly protein COX20, mitochondrial-like [Antedon mediterranea]|uniref:cytochrome c oxidase assembly protein COX20, mitochondrial-like n=1 Tax=Antedon mediterranea TaxID=105859 RepID=UPI003AF962AD
MVNSNQEDGWFVRVSNAFHSVPCMRTSLLYGIGGGVGTGIAYFLFTSRIKRACDFGILSMCVVTLGTFGKCRYSRAQKKLATRQLQRVDAGPLDEV